MLVLLIGLAGVIENRWIQQNLIRSNVDVAAVFMEGIIAPQVRRLLAEPHLSAARLAEMEAALDRSGINSHIQSVKVWKPDGTIVYATQDDLVGKVFNSPELKAAALGKTVFTFGNRSADNDLPGEEKGDAILEIYLPIHDEAGKVMAVGEFNQDLATSNRSAITTIRGSWLIRLGFLLLGLLMLFMLVRTAHNTIKRQQIGLKRNYVIARRLARQNQALRAVADETRRRSMQANEELLSLIGAEIHDGPIQLLSVAMLNAPRPDPALAAFSKAPLAIDFKAATAEAIDQLRFISSGLILPELKDLSTEDTIRLAVARHERWTGTEVEVEIGTLPKVAQGLKSCIYRIVQECLNNAARYADGKGQRVEAFERDAAVTVSVSDRGPGIRDAADMDGRPRLGILGAKKRIEAAGGSFHIASRPDIGTRITAVLPVETDRSASP